MFRNTTESLQRGDRGLAALAKVPAHGAEVAGAFESGVIDLRDAIVGGDRRQAVLAGFVESLQRLRSLPAGWDLEAALLIALESPSLLPHAAIIPSLLALESHPAFAEAVAMAQRGHGAGLAKLLNFGSLQAALARPLPLALLRSTVVSGPEIEFILTQLRRFLLGKAVQGFAPSEEERRLGVALAQQCFLNEYAFFVQPDEASLLERLTGGDEFAATIAACYAPLATRQAPAVLLAQQIDQPAVERGLTIDSLCPIEDPTSQRVRSLYEENPYPRWVKPYLAPTRDNGEIFRQRYFIELPGVEVPEILVAGCGTGFHLLTSIAGYREYRLTAIDLSRNSLAHAARHIAALKLPHIRLLQGDILDLDALPQEFDIIESVGVLHHMADPMAGWRILTGKLRPGGAMQIGLYSRIARAGLHRLRDYAKAQGFEPTRQNIIQFRHDVLAILRSPSHKLHPLVAEARLPSMLDFYSVSGCRDLLFHTQETAYTIRELARMIAELGLEFLGFSFPSPFFRAGYHARFPDDPAGTDLGNWDMFERENPNLFSRMYILNLRKK